MAQNELLGAAFCKGKLSSSSKPHPLSALAQESSASPFHPRPCALHRAMRGWVASGSLGPAALLGVSGTRNPLLTCSPSWGSRIGCAKAFCAQSPAMPPSQLGRSAPKSRRNGDPKRASGSCTLQRETLLQQQTTASPCLCAEAQHKLFPPPALRSPEGQAVQGCPWLPRPCCCAGGLRCPKPTPHGFSFFGKQDWAREAFCPLSQLGQSAPRPLRTDGPKQSSGSCILQRETLLGQQTTAPTRLGSRKQRKSFSPPAPPPP